ncbi:GAF domain-containing protein [Sandaracinus amylolyticus]|uniref:GAF domain protein n=1 Tax=Sandaracinus amylolyticus TaxID=927083 RepID=A0A0F6W2V7_9BACT|nr:GAF domain-containing protein [Sandaracinus amylolyticus]AKF06036.1 GAF domain protein [Sandaracinus amylolyticus]
MHHDALPLRASADDKRATYARVRASIESLIDGEDDWVAAMATVVCELHHAFESYDWTGFYRAVSPELLVIGPYQGGHGCLRIPFSRGVCGAAARTRETQLVPDVHAFPDHIACSSTTLSEIVVPVLAPDGRVLAVLDVDSNAPAAFDELDREALESLCAMLGARYSQEMRRNV